VSKLWNWFNTLIATNTFSEDAAHVLAAYGAVLTVVLLHASHYWYLGFVAMAALKEYVYDANFEVPHQTFLMNTADFLGYCVGILVGLGITHFVS
jgi:hypothetical protein